MNEVAKSPMGNIYSQLFYCILFGYAGIFAALFMFAVVFGVLDAFNVTNSYVGLVAFGSVSFYISWIGGVSSTGFDKLNHFWRGFLSTIFFNVGLVWYVKNKYEFGSFPCILVSILLLNVLLAIYGSQKCERIANMPVDGAEFNKSQMLLLAIAMPIPILGVAWILLLALFKLFSLDIF